MASDLEGGIQMTPTIRTALAAVAATALVASCGTSPQPRAAEDGGAAPKAARYRALQTGDLCACDAAFATATGPGTASATLLYSTTFSVVDQSAGDLTRVQIGIHDLSQNPITLTLYEGNDEEVTISGTAVTLTGVLQRIYGQDPRSSIAVDIGLDGSTGIVNLAIDDVPTFTGPASAYGVLPGSCLLPPFVPLPLPGEEG